MVKIRVSVEMASILVDVLEEAKLDADLTEGMCNGISSLICRGWVSTMVEKLRLSLVEQIKLESPKA